MREYDFTRREIKVKNLENKNTIFRHTDWIYGMILLAGDECLRLEINT